MGGAKKDLLPSPPLWADQQKREENEKRGKSLKGGTAQTSFLEDPLTKLFPSSTVQPDFQTTANAPPPIAGEERGTKKYQPCQYFVVYVVKKLTLSLYSQVSVALREQNQQCAVFAIDPPPSLKGGSFQHLQQAAPARGGQRTNIYFLIGPAASQVRELPGPIIRVPSASHPPLCGLAP